MAELTDKAIDRIATLARTAGTPQIIEHGNIPFAVIPADAKVESLEKFVFNDHAAAPERVKANVTVLDPESFTHYYQLFSDENSRVFADETAVRVVAIIDYHGALAGGSPRWCNHRLTLQLRCSPEWTRWTGLNGKQLTQEGFAEFLEQNSIDIIKPSPADMMEIARDLQATTEVEFGAGIRMQDGQIRFKYTEQVKATVGGGQVSVPERFTVNVPVFVGGPRVPMDALFRFRCKEGRLTLWYTLIRPEEVLRNAFIQSRDKIAADLNITIINGNA